MPNLAISASNTLQTAPTSSPASFSVGAGLHRGILLIEADTSLSLSQTCLLRESDYCVTPAFSHSEIFNLRDTKAIALAVISDSLGVRLLRSIAETVRKQWPLARILILGRASLLDDHLYDEQIERSSDPKQLLDDIERLYKDSWNERSNTIVWNGGRSCACPTRLPDPKSIPKLRRLSDEQQGPALQPYAAVP